MNKLRLIVLSVLIVILLSCSHKPAEKDRPGPAGNVEAYIHLLEKTSNSDSLVYYIGTQLIELDQAPDSVVAGYLKQVGMLYYTRSDYTKAANYFRQSEQLYHRADMQLQATQMLANQAVLKELRGNYKEAINDYLRAATLFNQLGDSASLASAWSNIGIVYEEMGLESKAAYYEKKSLHLKLQLHDTLSVASNYNNLGVIYFELEGLPDSALTYYKKASEIYDRYKSQSFQQAQAKNNLGMVYIKLNNFVLAKKYLNMAHAIFDSIGNIRGQASVQRYFGELYLARGKNEQALDAFHRAYELFKQVDDKKSQMELSELMAKVFISNRQYAEAAKIMELHNTLKDSLMNIKNQAAIAEMETKYHVGEMNKTIKLLQLEEEIHRRKIKSQAVLISLLSVIFILLVLVFYFVHYKNKLSQKQLRLELQNYLLTINKLQNEVEQKDNNFKFPENRMNEFDLSEREMEVLKYIAGGYKNAEIAEKLFVSQNTIKTHIKNIYVKLNVKNRVEALKKVDIV